MHFWIVSQLLCISIPELNTLTTPGIKLASVLWCMGINYFQGDLENRWLHMRPEEPVVRMRILMSTRRLVFGGSSRWYLFIILSRKISYDIINLNFRQLRRSYLLICSMRWLFRNSIFHWCFFCDYARPGDKNNRIGRKDIKTVETVKRNSCLIDKVTYILGTEMGGSKNEDEMIKVQI